jgi:hypothetical protein
MNTKDWHNIPPPVITAVEKLQQVCKDICKTLNNLDKDFVYGFEMENKRF